MKKNEYEYAASEYDLIQEILNQESRFNLRDFCYPKQYSFVSDPHRFVSAVTTRRSGKTTACAADLIDTSLKNPEVVCLYITRSRKNAKKLIFPIIEKIVRDHKLIVEPNISDLSFTFANKSVIYLAGVKDESSIEDFRGLPFKKVYLDEGQSMRSYIKELVDDVISPGLTDYAGSLRIIGTPGPVPVGYFYECSKNPEWAHHFFSMFDNPFLQQKSGKSAQLILDEELKRRGVTIDDPSIQREYFGKWVLDKDALVVKWSEFNHFDEIPKIPGKWEHIVGIDLGWDDADAIGVIGFNKKVPEAYLVEEIITRKQGITELAGQIDRVIKKYDPMKIVMDTGGLGKKIAEEIRKRYGIPIYPAEKVRKFEFIELLNDALRTKKFFAKRGSAFAQDSQLLEWDRDKSTSDKPVISDSFHSDIIEAVLYAFRESLHWLFEPEIIRPQIGTPEHFAEEERKIWEQVEQRLELEKEDQSFWEDPFES